MDARCAALYARVSTTRQAQTQTIEQQLERLRAAARRQGWTLDEAHVYRDDGYSGASLSRPGLDRLRDRGGPGRRGRGARHGARPAGPELRPPDAAPGGARPARLPVEFLDRPDEPGPARPAAAPDPRAPSPSTSAALIADRMRRGRLARLRAGHPPAVDAGALRLPRSTPDRPRDPAGVRVEPGEGGAGRAALRLVPGAAGDARRRRQAPDRPGRAHARRAGRAGTWPACAASSTIRPTRAWRSANRTRAAPAGRASRRSLPVGPGESHAARPPEDWIAVPVPAAGRRGGLRAGAGQAGARTRHGAPRATTRATPTCCAPWSAAAVPAELHRRGRPAPATATTSAAGAPTPCARPRTRRCAARYIPAAPARRAGLGRPVRAADRPRRGGPRAGPRPGRGLAAPGAPRPPAGRPPRPRAARAAAAAAPRRLPGCGRRTRRVRAHAAGAGGAQGRPGRAAAAARGARPAADRAQRRRRRHRGLLRHRPGGARGAPPSRSGAGPGRAPPRPGGRHRRRGGDPLRPAHSHATARTPRFVICG